MPLNGTSLCLLARRHGLDHGFVSEILPVLQARLPPAPALPRLSGGPGAGVQHEESYGRATETASPAASAQQPFVRASGYELPAIPHRHPQPVSNPLRLAVEASSAPQRPSGQRWQATVSGSGPERHTAYRPPLGVPGTAYARGSGE